MALKEAKKRKSATAEGVEKVKKVVKKKVVKETAPTEAPVTSKVSVKKDTKKKEATHKRKRNDSIDDSSKFDGTELDSNLVTSAISALLTHKSKKATNDLFDDEQKVFATVTINKIKAKPSNKPIQLPIPHPLKEADQCDMCLFIKAEDKPKIKAMLMESANPVPGLKKIISLDKLRTSYHRFERRRELLATYDLFLADDRILPMLCKTLGKTFFSRKKQPIPISITRQAALPRAIQRARESTYLFLPKGASCSVCVGFTSMKPNELSQNVMAALPAAIQRIPGEWGNVLSIHITSPGCASLPIYNRLPFPDAVQEAFAAAARAEKQASEESKKDTEETRKPKKAKKDSTADALGEPAKRAKKTAAPAVAAPVETKSTKKDKKTTKPEKKALSKKPSKTSVSASKKGKKN